MRVAAAEALRKERKPHLYCPERRCLWHTGTGYYCPRHQPTSVREAVLAQLRQEGRRP